jgi:hypothetical protein
LTIYALSLSRNFTRIELVVSLEKIAVALVFFKGDLRPYYEEVYVPNRFFYVIADWTLCHKVTVHENLFRWLYGSEARFRSMQYLKY